MTPRTSAWLVAAVVAGAVGCGGGQRPDPAPPAGGGGGYLNGGTGWYRKTFTLPASSSGQKVFIQFDGVYMDSTVYLNGTQVGARPYGFSSFECDLTAAAKFGGSNVLAVRVNNQQPSSRWY